MGNSPVVARINSLLAEKGISKQDFYRDCKITSASYSLWNTGKTAPRKKNLEVIAQYLHTSTEYLLTGLGEKEKAPIPEDERNDEVSALLEFYRSRPDDCRMLFSVAKTATAEDIKAAAALIEALRKKEGR